MIAWVFVSLDGYSAGPGNDMSRIAEHAGHEQTMAYTEGIWPGPVPLRMIDTGW